MDRRAFQAILAGAMLRRCETHGETKLET